MVVIPEAVDVPKESVESGVPPEVVAWLVHLNATSETKVTGKWIDFWRLKYPDQWLVQHHDGYERQLVSVHRVEAGSVRTLSVVVMPSFDVFDTCRVAIHVCQTSGTCYFHTAVNMCCLGTEMARLTMKGIEAQVALCTEAERKLFFEEGLNLTVCPASFTKLDVLRLLYALVSPLSPTKLAADIVATQTNYNVMAEAIYALGFRSRTRDNNPEYLRVGHVGGQVDDALGQLFLLLGISFGAEHRYPANPDVIISSGGE